MSPGRVLRAVKRDPCQEIGDFESHLLQDEGKDAVHFKTVSSPPVPDDLAVERFVIQQNRPPVKHVEIFEGMLRV